MEFIANIIGISTQQAWAIFGAAIVAILIGCMVKYLGRFLVIGAVAIVVIAFLHEHATLNLPMAATQPPQEASAPVAVPDTPASAPEAASDAVLSPEEAAFIKTCVENGDGDGVEDCVNLFAEKKYIEAQDARQD